MVCSMDKGSGDFHRLPIQVGPVGRRVGVPNDRSLIGPRRFQWNRAGWFGASLGSTAWMLVTAGFLIVQNQTLLALVPAIGFAVTLAASMMLWARRDRIYPFAALMALLTLLALTMPLVWFIVSSYGTATALALMNWPTSRAVAVGVAAIVPLSMLWLIFLERSAPTNRPFQFEKTASGTNNLT